MNKSITASQAKYIAIAAMAINHVGHVFGRLLPHGMLVFSYYIGGMTFPIMAYMASEGYKRTSNRREYMFRLAVFAIISVYPFWLAFNTYRLDVIFTIFFGVASLYMADAYDAKFGAKSPISIALKIVTVTLLATITALCDWGVEGVLIIFAMGNIKSGSIRAVLPILALFLYKEGPALYNWLAHGVYASYMIPYMFGCITAVPVLLLYANGFRKGKGPKYLFYAFYPAHLLILYFANAAYSIGH